MARPQKSGLEYFPLDVDIDQDDKIALIEAQHGLVGFGIVIKLLMKIYKHNYFYEWTEKEQLLFSKRVNVDINSINVIINDCVKWGIFNQNMFASFEILTSHGIQKRYIEAVGRRQRVEIDKKYLLLDNETINVYKNLVIVNISTHSEVVNVNINPQSKVKESKGKEIKVNNSKEESTEEQTSTSFQNKDIYNLYEQSGFGLLNLTLTELIDAAIEINTKEWVIDAMKEAVRQGKYKYSYVEGILRNWKTNGKEKVHAKDSKRVEDPNREGIGFELGCD